MKKISVVVPTYNRAKKLPKVLKLLANQTLNHSDYEVIVTDNNSSDNTREVVQKFEKKFPEIFRYVCQKKRGAAANRNLGAKQAKAPLILFLDDDMWAEKNLVEEHFKAHDNFEGSVLGFFETAWEGHDNLFLRYLKDSEMQNSFPFEDQALVTYHYFFTGNVSVRKSIFDKVEGFDEGFTVYGVEDIDLGYRLWAAGEKMKFHQKALSFHNYEPDYETFKQKRCHAGYSLGYFVNKYPHLSRHFSFGPRPFVELGLLNLVFKILKPLIFLWRPNTLTKMKYGYFHWTIRWGMYRGMQRFKKEQKLNTLGQLLD
jgi:glycosyltransferase involved in cell wall biosynthesis